MATLTNKTALITGASRGIGRATARAIAAAGAFVIVHYGKSRGDAESLVAEIRRSGGKADAAGADLSSPEEVDEFANKTRALVGDRLDILVANAAISKAGRVGDYAVPDFDKLFATNVRGPFFLIQHLLPLLGEGSSVIVVTSLAARLSPAFPGQAGAPAIPAYAATKGALETLVKHWASLFGPSGIRVNAVAPGIIETDMSNFTKTELGRDLALNMQALKRIGRPDDVADVITFLASEGARWITGASIPVDGGSKL